MDLTPQEVDIFERSRDRLQAIAYRMVGSASDAEDLTQDAFLRWQAADRARIITPEAWLTKVITNLCLNHLTSARVRRESYIGEWLPEPVLDSDSMLGPAETVEQRESLSLAVLVVLETLSPTERVVYVLREAFGYPHREIAEILEISESNSQQLYRRSKAHLAAERTRTQVRLADAYRVTEEFLTAALSGDVNALVELLTDDAVSIADGGGQVPARRTPAVGAAAVARAMHSLFNPNEALRKLIGGRIDLYPAQVNGGPAVLAFIEDRLSGVVVLESDGEHVSALLIHANPEKLVRISREWMSNMQSRTPFASVG